VSLAVVGVVVEVELDGLVEATELPLKLPEAEPERVVLLVELLRAAELSEATVELLGDVEVVALPVEELGLLDADERLVPLLVLEVLGVMAATLSVEEVEVRLFSVCSAELVVEVGGVVLEDDIVLEELGLLVLGEEPNEEEELGEEESAPLVLASVRLALDDAVEPNVEPVEVGEVELEAESSELLLELDNEPLPESEEEELDEEGVVLAVEPVVGDELLNGLT
jgi:hypothetical protein